VKLNLGYFLAILILFSTRSTGQVLHEQRSQAFGNSPVSRPPITNQQRLNWFVRSTVGQESLTAGLFTAGFGTGLNRPREYGPHWEGYGKRYGMRFTGIATGNAMEAALGSLWGEDPRYFRATSQSVKGRIKNVIAMTVVARQDDGTMAPAYARYIGTSGNNFLSNTWRADSESGVGDACLRTALGFAGRMGGNAFAEFWPTVTKHLFHKRD
jgi:hypothetical protein